MAIPKDHPAVQKAFDFLSKKYQRPQLLGIGGTELFEDEFECEFIETSPYQWSVEFINESDETLFLLKWS